MERFGSVEEILNFAIAKEREAAEFYMMLADRQASPALSKVFEEFAKEEMAHKAKLEKVKEGKIEISKPQQVKDLKIGDYLVEPSTSQDMTFQEALVLAMKREKAAFRLYNDLAAMVDDESLRAMLLGLAQEEAKHKLRFEIEYEEQFMAEN